VTIPFSQFCSSGIFFSPRAGDFVPAYKVYLANIVIILAIFLFYMNPNLIMGMGEFCLIYYLNMMH